MTTETILTSQEISDIWSATVEEWGLTLQEFEKVLQFARAIEKAVLQSDEIQALRRDAERWRKAASHVYEIKRTYEKSEENRIRRLQIDIRKTSVSALKWLEDSIDTFGVGDNTMEQHK